MLVFPPSRLHPKINCYAKLGYSSFVVHDKAHTERLEVQYVEMWKKRLLQFSTEDSNSLEWVKVSFCQTESLEELCTPVFKIPVERNISVEDCAPPDRLISNFAPRDFSLHFLWYVPATRVSMHSLAQPDPGLLQQLFWLTFQGGGVVSLRPNTRNYLVLSSLCVWKRYHQMLQRWWTTCSLECSYFVMPGPRAINWKTNRKALCFATRELK